MRSLTTGPDGEWVLARSGRQVALLPAGKAPALGKLIVDTEDVDLAIVNGPPNVVVAATRGSGSTRVSLHLPPELDSATTLELPTVSHIATTCPGRVVMVSADHREMTIIRAAGRGLSAHAVDLQRKTVDFVVGLERNQLIVSLQGRLEVWDAVSGRPLRKLALDVPPAPRTIGLAAGNLWAIRSGSDEVLAYRLSDGRPFQHFVRAQIDGVVSHPNSPVIVFITPRGLIRLHCFAHSVLPIECPWQPESPVPLAQLVGADDITLLGWPEQVGEPWRVSITGATPIPQGSSSTASTATAGPTEPIVAVHGRSSATGAPPSLSEWRQELVAFAQEAVRGTTSALPPVAVDTELSELGQRLGLSAPARRAMIAMYSLYLIGEPMVAIAALARILGDWAEPLGKGQLEQVAMLHRSNGKLGLAPQVTDALDGRAPSEIRLVGGPATVPRSDLFQIARNGRVDSTLESALVAQLKRIAVIESSRVAAALLEARLHGATAVARTIPTERPRPWPLGAGLVVIVDSLTQQGWLAAAPDIGL